MLLFFLIQLDVFIDILEYLWCVKPVFSKLMQVSMKWPPPPPPLPGQGGDLPILVVKRCTPGAKIWDEYPRLPGGTSSHTNHFT